MLADVGQGTLDVLTGVDDGHGLAVALGDSHDADEAAFFVSQGHLVGDEPIRNALLIEEELDDVELGLSGAENLFVIPAKILGETAGEDIEVVFIHELVFTLEAHGLNEVAIGADEAETAVFGEKGDAGQGIKHPVRLALEIERAQEFGAQLGGISGFHVRSLNEFRHGSSRDAELGLGLQVTPDDFTRTGAAQERLIGLQDALGLGLVLFEKLDTVMTQPSLHEASEELRSSLRNGIEEGVSAADIGLQRMLHADTVAQADLVMVTGTAAVGEVGAFG